MLLVALLSMVSPSRNLLWYKCLCEDIKFNFFGYHMFKFVQHVHMWLIQNVDPLLCWKNGRCKMYIWKTYNHVCWDLLIYLMEESGLWGEVVIGDSVLQLYCEILLIDSFCISTCWISPSRKKKQFGMWQWKDWEKLLGKGNVYLEGILVLY